MLCKRTLFTYGCAIASVIIAITLYVDSMQKNSNFYKAQQIYHALDTYRITYDIDARSVDPTHSTTPQPIKGVNKCIQQLSTFVAKQEPVRLLLVGFPFKLPNHEKKTLGDLPDMAERRSLEYLQKALDSIRGVYAPGAHLTIFCDGVAFAEFFGVSQRNVAAYENALQRLATDLPDIKLYTSTDWMRDHKLNRINEINMILDSYPPSNQEIQTCVQPVFAVARKRFALELDYAAGRKILEQQTLDFVVFGILAREARMRNYITQQFPANQFLRLTVHFSSDISKKFGIKVSPSSDITPYHGVLVEEEDGAWSIQFKKDIDTRNYALVSKIVNGVDCKYFRRVHSTRTPLSTTKV
jgi:pyoverdine/dityrosine biosynthesis protein Dit1